MAKGSKKKGEGGDGGEKKSKGKKGGGGGKKPGKGGKQDMELAKQRAAQQEQERQAREAEQQAIQEKKAGIEKAEREGQLIASSNCIQTFDKWVLGRIEKDRDTQEWKTFVACRNVPNFVKLSEVNAYLEYWRCQLEKPNMKKLLKLTPELLEVIEELKEFLKLPAQACPIDMVSELGLLYHDMIKYLQTYLDKCTYAILQDLSDLYDPEVGIFEYLLSITQLTHCLWGNMFQCPDYDGHNFEDIEFKFKIPENLIEVKGVFRLVKTEFDHYSSACKSYFAPAVDNALKRSIQEWIEKNDMQSLNAELASPDELRSMADMDKTKSKTGKKKKGKKDKKKGKKGKKGKKLGETDSEYDEETKQLLKEMEEEDKRQKKEQKKEQKASKKGKKGKKGKKDESQAELPSGAEDTTEAEATTDAEGEKEKGKKGKKGQKEKAQHEEKAPEPAQEEVEETQAHAVKETREERRARRRKEAEEEEEKEFDFHAEEPKMKGKKHAHGGDDVKYDDDDDDEDKKKKKRDSDSDSDQEKKKKGRKQKDKDEDGDEEGEGGGQNEGADEPRPTKGGRKGKATKSKSVSKADVTDEKETGKGKKGKERKSSAGGMSTVQMVDDDDEGGKKKKGSKKSKGSKKKGGKKKGGSKKKEKKEKQKLPRSVYKASAKEKSGEGGEGGEAGDEEDDEEAEEPKGGKGKKGKGGKGGKGGGGGGEDKSAERGRSPGKKDDKDKKDAKEKKGGGKKGGDSKSKSPAKERGKKAKADKGGGKKEKKGKGSKDSSKSKSKSPGGGKKGGGKGKKGKKGGKSGSRERPKTEAELAKERERKEKADFIPVLHENELNLRMYHILGGSYTFQLLDIPPQPTNRGKWTIHIKEYDCSLKDVPFTADFIPPPPTDMDGGAKKTPEEMEKEAKKQEEELQKLAVVDIKLDLPTIELVNPELDEELAAQKAEEERLAAEAEKEKQMSMLLSYNFLVPKNVLWFEPPIPVRWDPVQRYWSQDGFYDIKFDEGSLHMSFRTTEFGTFGLGHNRWLNLPYQTWELRPMGKNKVFFALTASMAVLEFIIQGDQVCVSNIDNVTNADDVRSSLLDKYMRPNKLIKTLREHNLDVFPEIDSYAYVDGILVKNYETEDHLYQCMAMAATAFNFQWSRWNMLAGREKLIFQFRERHGTSSPGNYQMVLNTPRKCVRIDCTEVSPNYSESPVEEFEYQPDLLNLVRSIGTPDALSIIAHTNPHHVETVRTILTAVRPLTFS